MADRMRFLATPAWASVLWLTVAGSASAAGLPLRFEPNYGQTDSAVRFLARGADYTLFLTATEAVMVMPATPSAAGRSASGGAVDLRMKILGGSPDAKAAGLEQLAGRSSYFVGSDPALWRKGMPTFARVSLSGVYPGIDLVYYGREGSLEYDFVVAAGVDPSLIRLGIDGVDAAAIDDRGDLVLTAAGRQVRWHRPVCYQDIDGTRRFVDGNYERLADGVFGFRLGGYDTSRALVIDPVLVYATYLAPTTFAIGDGLQNHGLAVTADADGYAYVAGVTESASFPATAGAFRTTRPGKRDVFVVKLSPDASELEYATYLGGSETEVQNGRSLGIAVDAAGNAYVAGSTSSTNFPVTGGAHQTMPGGQHDGFVAKISADGSDLVYSTYLGGTGIDYAWDIALDGQGQAYVCGETNGSFPTTPGAYQTASTSLSAFVSKLSADGSDLLWSTTLGTNTGTAHAVAVDAGGHAHVTGSADTPHGLTGYPVTDGAFQTDGKGSFDAVVTRLAPDGATLEFSTYLGGSANEVGNGIALDAQGNIYVAGNTNSTDFPATDGAFQTSFQSTPTPVDDGFVIKLTPEGDDAVYATYLGTAAGEDILGVVVDGAGSAIVTGSTGSTAFPTTDGAFQETFTPAAPFGSAIVSKLTPQGDDLEYSTYLHPTDSGLSIAYGIGLDGAGGVYVTGTSAPLFPTTDGAFQEQTWNPAFGGPVVAKLAIATPPDDAICGDFNDDGKITASDALAALRAALGVVSCALSRCDANGDGKLTATDALAILRAAVGQSVTMKCP